MINVTIAQATAERDKAVGLWRLLRRVRSKDSLRAMAAAVDFLEAFGRHLHSLDDATPGSSKTVTPKDEGN